MLGLFQSINSMSFMDESRIRRIDIAINSVNLYCFGLPKLISGSEDIEPESTSGFSGRPMRPRRSRNKTFGFGLTGSQNDQD